MKTARSIIDWPKMPAGRIAIAAAGFGLAIVLLLATAGSGSTLLAMGVAAGSAVAGWFAATAFRADAASHQPIRPSIHGETAEHEQILSLRKAVETMQLGVTITDLDGQIRYSNPAEAKMHGYTLDELIGEDGTIFAPTAQAEPKPLSQKEVSEFDSWQRETINRRKNGTLFPVKLLSDAVRTASGEVVGVVTTCEDITERLRAEEQLRESEEQYERAVRGSKDVLWDWDLVTNTLYLSPRWDDLIGGAERAPGNSPEEWLGRVQQGDLEDLKVQIAAHLQGVSPHLEHEHRVNTKHGRHRWVLCRGTAVRDETGKATRFAGSMTDITGRKQMEARLEHDALHDGLTGLPNRTFFTEMVQRAIGRAGRDHAKAYAVLFVDIDRLKVVNDGMGHKSGDRLLNITARRLEACVRPGDIVARLGGDEFTILLDEVSDLGFAKTVASRIVKTLQQPCTISGHEVGSSASVGIAMSSPEYDRPEQIIRDADLAMYRAKQRGKARYEVFNRTMHQQAVSALQLETDLRLALDREEFAIRYQPIVALDSGSVIGLEALVRWEHPKRGTVYPSDFITVAEEIGLIIPLGRWILREACGRLHEWQQRFKTDAPLYVSVNVSPRQLDESGFVDDLTNIVRDAGLRPADLQIELTEGILLESEERRSMNIRRLMDAGIRVQIDDFGTGYSALSQLQHFSFDTTLKIDRAFVSQLAGPRDNLEIVRAIVAMARTLGMSVIAEGVETEDQRRQLQELHCEQGQGYLFSHALDREGVEELLAASN